MIGRIQLRPKRDFSVRNRHPWIFSGGLEAPSVACGSGEPVAVVSASGETLGYGAYSPQSQIRVRMWSFDPRVALNRDWVAQLVREAVVRRAALLATAATNAVRLINAESDGLPGVVVDRYADFAVAQFSSAGAEYWKAEIVAELMRSVPGIRGVSERRDLKDREKEALPTEPQFQVLSGEAPPAVIEIFEGPCKFRVDVRNGHKTGFYLDQRDARKLVGSLSQGREVLNCFAYTGGFGLYARAGGARRVVQVDISPEALARARENESLTPGSATEMEYVEADVFDFLRRCRDAGRTFDLIVLDPPKFAASKGQLMKAARGYKDINLLAMKLLRPQGLLATFSCSGAMSAPFFDQVLSDAARDAGRSFQVIARTGPGSDHPVALAFPEGAYLKGVILRAM